MLPQQAPSSINGSVLGYVIDDNVQCYGHAWGYVHPVLRREGGVFSEVDPTCEEAQPDTLYPGS